MDMTLQDPLVGRVVDGRYLVESRIAHGGMATVYLALDRRLDREVALKVMHDHLAGDQEFVSRFVREARAAARLSHANVVQVFDQGSDDSVLYLAMEYLPGRTLRDVLAQRGALTPRESVSVMEPVLAALAAAHRAGIVHRDVKPENVILTDDGRIKVADFGLARAVAAPITSNAPGQLLGTVAYLAPELVSRGVADARADVYAAGILLFELLTGKQPFTGDDPLQVAYRHVHEIVPAPSSVAPALPAAFDDVVLRATDHDPDRRPADAGALLSALLAARSYVADDQLDVRAADAATLRLDAARTRAFGEPLGGPAAAAAPQATRALAVPSRRAARAAPGRRGGAPLLPRLAVHDDEEPPPGFLGDRRRQAIAAVAAAVVAVLVIFTGVWWFTGGPGSYTSTPSLVGQRESDARRILSGQGLGNVVRRVFNAKVATGQVVSTEPAAGEHVKKNGTVTLNISKGPELVGVPDVTGQTVDDATAALRKAGLKVGATTSRFTAKVDKDRIVSSSPERGSKVPPGREVDLVVSKGAEPVVLDNVMGQQVDAAKQTLEGKGLNVDVQEVDWTPGSAAPGTVVNQAPMVQTPGQVVEKGSTVTLTVVKAAEGMVGVPNVVGQNFRDAKRTLEQVGFTVNRQGFPGLNKVTGQSVQGQAPAGTQIVLTVGF